MEFRIFCVCVGFEQFNTFGGENKHFLKSDLKSLKIYVSQLGCF